MKEIKFKTLVFLIVFVANFQAKAAPETEENPREATTTSLEARVKALKDSLPEEFVNDDFKLSEAAEMIGGEVGLAILMEVVQELFEGEGREARGYRGYRTRFATSKLLHTMRRAAAIIVAESDYDSTLLKKLLYHHDGILLYGGPMGSPSREILEKFVQDEDPKLREWAFYEGTDGSYDNDFSLSFLQDFTQDENPEIRISIIKKVAYIGGRKAVDILKELSRDEDPKVRAWVAEGASQIKTEGLSDLVSNWFYNWLEERNNILRELSRDEDPKVRAWVADAVHRIEIEDAVDILIGLAQNVEDPEIRNYIIESANKIGGEVGLAILMELPPKD